jgi:glycosyltransferase involved in cell wall biosynthesis
MTAVAYALVLLPLVMAVYSYVLYPAILWVIAQNREQAVAPPQNTSAPLVTVVIPAYNEEAQIRGAIEAVLAQDYASDRLQTLVVSDASTDATDDIVRSYSSRGVEFLRMPTRGGKTAAENASLPHIRGEIVINTDSSVRLHPEAVRHLVASMADPSVGVASTRDISVTAPQNANRAEADYVGYEMRIRQLETLSGGIVGASGSGYAIRRHLHAIPVRADLSRDFSAALTARRHGLRAISADEAFCFVPRTGSLRQEYKRKVRTISRGMETLNFNRDLLDLANHGAFAWKLLSHKVCRWLVPILVLPALVGLGMLAVDHVWPRVVLVLAAIGAGVAVLGARWPDSRKLPRALPVGIVGALSANLAVVHSAWRFVHGHDDHIWEPTRRTAAAEEGPRAAS